MSRTLGIACLLVVVAVGGWLWFDAPDAGAPAPAMPVEDAATARNDASIATPVEVAAEAPPTSQREAAEQVSAADGTAIPADAVWIELTVVDGVSKQPVADADVWWSNEVQQNRVLAMPVRQRNAYFADHERITRELGWHTRTGADGSVRVTPGANGATVMASDGTRYGRGYFSDQGEQPAAGHRLEITLDRTLLVRVLDAANQPAAGVPVELAQHDQEQGKPPAPGQGNRQTTDADGIATFAHVQTLQSWQWGARRGKPVASWVISIATQGFDLEPVSVDAQAPPINPVELQLPATGHLRARATFEGRSMPGLEHLRLFAGPERTTSAVNTSWNQPTDEDGWVRFRHVPLGQTFFCGTHQWDRTIVGPVAPGQEIVTELEIADEVFALSGRLLAQGQPLVEQSVSTDFDLEVTMGGGQVRTDLDGRFLWILTRAGTRTSAQIKRLAFHQQLPDAPPLRCSVEPREMKVGRNELGDLRLAVDALVVSGQLVFDRPDRKWAIINVERFVASERPGRDGRWQQVEGLQTVLHPDRRFEVRGGVEPGRYRLAFQAYNYLPVEPIEFAPGTKDLVIEIACGTPLQVTCRLPEGLEGRRLRAMLTPQDASPGKTSITETATSPSDLIRRDDDHLNLLNGQFHRQADGTATYSWHALADGLYTLRFEVSGSKKALLEIADVAVPPTDGGDPRLTDIDLRDTIHLLKLTVYGRQQTEGAHEHGTLFILPQPDDADWQGITVSAGETVLPVPAGPVDLLFVMNGCAPMTLRAVEGAAEITPEPWPSLALTFAGSGELPDDVRLLAGVPAPRGNPRDRRRYVTEGRSGPLDSLLNRSGGYKRVENGTATIQLQPGVQQLQILVLVGRRSKRLTQVTPSEVVAGAGVTVQLSADEIRSLVDQLQKEQKK